MRAFRLSGLFPLIASGCLFVGNPAQARITVVDGGITMAVSGYCTPDPSSCAPQALPFPITVGGTSYSTFRLNGNGTLTLGDAPIDWNNISSNLADFPMPVFSPQIDNTTFLRDDLLGPQGTFDVDTNWAASFQTTTDSLTAYWFVCTSAIFCGTASLPAELYDGPLTVDEVRDRQSWYMFSLTLTNLGDGFALDYFYYPYYALSPDFQYSLVVPTGSYGFNLPGTATLQTTGPLVERSWTFDEAGQLTSVPEPGTWLMMLAGFTLMGLFLRRQRDQALRNA